MAYPTRLTIGVLSLLTLALAAAAPAPTSQPASPPRYDLKVGQEITYRLHWHAVQYGHAEETTSKFIIQVIGHTPDGVGWRLMSGADRDGPSVFALWPDGHTDPVDDDRPPIFPPLPPTDAIDSVWTAPNANGGTDTFRRVPTTRPADAGMLAFSIEQHSVFDGPYDEHDGGTGLFDPTRKLIARATHHFQFGHGKKGGSGDGEYELVSTATTRPAEWTADYARQIDATTAAHKAYIAALYADAKRSPTAGPTTRLSDLSAARAKITDPALTASLAELAARDKQMIGYLQQSSHGEVDLVGHPAPDWTMTDLDGHPHKLSDLRGRVVVLDFWYLMCPYCIRAMPQVKQLSLDYANRPVSVFGVNTDDDIADARKAVDALALPYPQLRASMRSGTTTRPAVPQDYQVHGYPTLIVIGPDGVIRHVHVGFTKTLREEVGHQIDALLSAPATRPAGSTPSADLRSSNP